MHFYSWIVVILYGDTVHLAYINLHTLIVQMSGANGNTQMPVECPKKVVVGSQVLVLGMLFIPG